jgi:hypothetical protein
MSEVATSVATWSTEQWMLEMAHGRIAAGDTTVVSTAAVLRWGKQMEKTTALVLSLDSLFQKVWKRIWTCRKTDYYLKLSKSNKYLVMSHRWSSTRSLTDWLTLTLTLTFKAVVFRDIRLLELELVREGVELGNRGVGIFCAVQWCWKSDCEKKAWYVL